MVGAGPGGSLAALRLAQLGREVCLLEKESFPRYKPCGGGIPPHGMRLLRDTGVNVDPYVESVCDRVRFLFDFEDPVDSDLSDAAVTMVNRADFDTALARQARERGAVLREEALVRDVDLTGDGCTVTLACGDTLHARFVVGADGASSRVARSLEIERGFDLGVALDAEVTVDEETYRRERPRATFNVNVVERGYGWIFPKNGYLALGVGGYDRSRPYPDLIDAFVDRSVGEEAVQECDLYGHPLPFFRESVPVTRGPVGLVGDAAGMVDSLSGEGIFYALKSGRLVAECIDEALRSNREDLANYQRRVEGGIHRELGWSARLARVFFAFPRRCYEHGVKRPRVVDWIKQVVISDGTYDEIYRELWDEIRGRMGRSLKQVPGLS